MESAFAEGIGVSRQALWRYKDGSRVPHRSILARIFTATGGQVTANDFVPEAAPVALTAAPAEGAAA